MKVKRNDQPSKPRADVINIQGVVAESLPNTMFRVQVTQGPEEMMSSLVLCTLNGTMRRFRIRVLPGDEVLADVSIYDRSKGRITRRLRTEAEQQPTEVQSV